jgi:hypothetical protein
MFIIVNILPAMLKTLKFQILFAVFLILHVLICISVLQTPPVDETNTTIANLHLRAVSLNKPARGSLNYDFYVLENNGHYKISAEWADCFYYNDFMNKVKPGQLIQARIKKQNGFLSSDLRLVVSLTANGQNYLDGDCVNKELAEEKIDLPVYGTLGLMVIYTLLYYHEWRNAKKKRGKAANSTPE